MSHPLHANWGLSVESKKEMSNKVLKEGGGEREKKRKKEKQSKEQ